MIKSSINITQRWIICIDCEKVKGRRNIQTDGTCTIIMSYPIRCFMPYDRVVCIQNHKIKEYDVDLKDEAENSEIVCVILKDIDTPQIMTADDLSNAFQIVHSKHLIFAHERVLREIMQMKVGSDPEYSDMMENRDLIDIARKLSSGYVHKGVSIRHIGIFDGVDIGYGLFSDEEIVKDAYIGEYVGVVSTHSSPDPHNKQAYCCQYASCSGDMYINALEYGSIIRFINHSEHPNAELRTIEIEGLPHVICFAIQDLAKDEQILINYGASYWQGKETNHVSIK